MEEKHDRARPCAYTRIYRARVYVRRSARDDRENEINKRKTNFEAELRVFIAGEKKEHTPGAIRFYGYLYGIARIWS